MEKFYDIKNKMSSHVINNFRYQVIMSLGEKLVKMARIKNPIYYTFKVNHKNAINNNTIMKMVLMFKKKDKKEILKIINSLKTEYSSKLDFKEKQNDDTLEMLIKMKGK
jgi:deoxyribodipyrimidine photolyase-like uncharacterized protein